jgi:CheY-like chemotaxis protein
VPTPVPDAAMDNVVSHCGDFKVSPPRGIANRVLVVDPCADTLESTGWLLQRWGFRVQSAANGLAALEAARTFSPDAVLMEIGLPILDGWQVARQLRSAKQAPSPLLAAITGYGTERDRARSREAGFDCHFLKPVPPDDLRTWLMNQCNLSGGPL